MGGHGGVGGLGLQVAELAILLEKELKRIVHLVACFHDQDVELLGVPLLVLSDGFLDVHRLDGHACGASGCLHLRQVDNSSGSHLALELRLERLNAIDSSVDLSLLIGVQLD